MTLLDSLRSALSHRVDVQTTGPSSGSVRGTTVTTTRSELAPIRVAGAVAGLAALGYVGYRIVKRMKYMDPFFQRKSKENKLLEYVVAHATKGDVTSVINTIDQYCYAGNWMMNVGDKKGEILDAEIRKAQPQTVLEVGGYCGYSALRTTRQLPAGSHLYSIEFDALNAAIATKIIEYAGMKDRVTVIIGVVGTRISVLKQEFGIKKLDLVFLDHEKSVYLSDFKLLEQANLIQTGTVVVADNCLFPGCPDYVAYIRDHPQYVSVCHEAELEYESSVKDHVWVSTRK